MQDIIVPIDILERFENENDVSAAPPDDLLYVFCPNRKEDNTISSYSAFPMTVKDLWELYPDPPNLESEDGFCTFEQYNDVYNKFLLVSSYYYNIIRPIILSAFPEPKDLTANYMCRIKRTKGSSTTLDNFPYLVDWSSSQNKRTPANTLTYSDYPTPGQSVTYSEISAVRKKRTYHEWADFQTHVTDLSVLARLAPRGQLSSADVVASDKYLEWRKQFVISLLMNRKRRLMTNLGEVDLYSEAIQVSRKIRFSETKEIPEEDPQIDDLQLGNETLLE